MVVRRAEASRRQQDDPDAGFLTTGPGRPWGADVVAATPERRGGLGALVGGMIVAAGFIPVWIASAVLVAVAAIIAPATLSSDSWSAVLPLMTVLAVAALGQMLVVMTGGIDLSIPGAMFLGANVLVGISGSSDERLPLAVLVCLGWTTLIGLANGVLVGVLGLNPLIVTLAVGQIVLGFAIEYALGIANESSVPHTLSSWATSQPLLGIGWIFWLGFALTLAVALLLRSTAAGRRFQAVGANPRAAWIAGIHVRSHVVFAYTAAGALYGVAAILLAALTISPGPGFGDPYLLGPIAAVVIGGASLAGGTASATSTWVAAFALTVLSQMLRVLGLSPALQFVVFGAAIVAGMVISGDRIVAVLGGLLQRPGAARYLGTGGRPSEREEEPEPRDDTTGERADHEGPREGSVGER